MDRRCHDPPGRGRLGRLVPIAVLAVGLAAFFALGLHRYVSLEALRHHRDALAAYVAHHGATAALAYVGAYTAAVAISVPGAALLTVAGGFLFGPVLGTVYAAVGATAGATVVFLAARHAFADTLRRRVGGAAERMAAGFERHALSYLLFLRLVPLFPFWLVNLVPAFLRVRLGTFVLGTALGILPPTAVFALIGDGLGAVLEAGGPLDASALLTPRVYLPLAALGLLALVPVVYNRRRRQPR